LTLLQNVQHRFTIHSGVPFSDMCNIVLYRYNLSLTVVSGFTRSAPVCHFPTLPRMTFNSLSLSPHSGGQQTGPGPARRNRDAAAVSAPAARTVKIGRFNSNYQTISSPNEATPQQLSAPKAEMRSGFYFLLAQQKCVCPLTKFRFYHHRNICGCSDSETEPPELTYEN